ncbi:hypothetical protein FACS1894214_3510 [Planctomycetales bacterium]|nr:hypothetical protein FACS1894214_3510 [Planctomycetales bacterium]
MQNSRRKFIKDAGLTFLGLPVIGSSFYQKAVAASTAGTEKNKPLKLGKAKSVIQIWMWGGPSHLETFDPKPQAGRDYCGDWNKLLKTNVSGVEISQSLPKMAECADLYSIVRGMSHGTNHHEQASYIMQTGRMPGGGLVFPGVGAVISKIKGYDNNYDHPIPPYVVLTVPQGRFSESGFLGPKYKPFVTGGDPSKSPFLVSGYVVEGITDTRREQRKKLQESLDVFGKEVRNDALIEEIEAAKDNAYKLITGSAAKTFDLGLETEKVRNNYGNNWFGQSCLTARRLVQEGIPYITINYRGWDTHKKHFEVLSRNQPEWDQGLSALLRDLADKGLLDSTIVWWGGEFGRTPKIGWNSPWFGGRGHFGSCFNVVLAGGGFRGGRIAGESNDTGEKVVKRPVAPQDLLGSIYAMLGIDPAGPLPNEKGIDVPLMPEPSAEGFLHELVG